MDDQQTYEEWVQDERKSADIAVKRLQAEPTTPTQAAQLRYAEGYFFAFDAMSIKLGQSNLEVSSSSLDLCTKCFKQAALCGDITDAPIAQQAMDITLNVKREWLSKRYWCTECEHMFDVIIINKVVDDGQR